jgi:uncharacterized membrane protein YkvA (DUF1232 family)
MEFSVKLRELTKKFKQEITVYRNVMRDERTPFTAKLLLWLAVSYLLLPFDLIPDFIPVLGQLDDIVIVPLLVYFALKLIPEQILIDNREKLVTRF